MAFINCGAAGDITDHADRVWAKDGARAGGKALNARPHWVAGTKDWLVYTNAGEGMDAYRLPVEDGTYVVRLHFAEVSGGGGWRGGQSVKPGDRVFSVSLESETVLADFDIIEAAAGRRYKSVIRQFTVQVKDGELTVEFAKSADREGARNLPALINAIEVWRPQ